MKASQSKRKPKTLNDISKFVYTKSTSLKKHTPKMYPPETIKLIITQYFDQILETILKGESFYVPYFGAFYLAQYEDKNSTIPVFISGKLQRNHEGSRLKGYYVKLACSAEVMHKNHMQIIASNKWRSLIGQYVKNSNHNFILVDENGNPKENTNSTSR